MRFKLEGRVYDFDQTTMLVEEARILKSMTGFGLRSFSTAMQDGDPDALVGMLFLAKRRAGEAVQWADFDKLNLNSLEILTDEEVKPLPEGGGDVPNPASVETADPDASVPPVSTQPLQSGTTPTGG